MNIDQLYFYSTHQRGFQMAHAPSFPTIPRKVVMTALTRWTSPMTSISQALTSLVSYMRTILALMQITLWVFFRNGAILGTELTKHGLLMGARSVMLSVFYTFLFCITTISLRIQPSLCSLMAPGRKGSVFAQTDTRVWSDGLRLRGLYHRQIQCSLTVTKKMKIYSQQIHRNT